MTTSRVRRAAAMIGCFSCSGREGGCFDFCFLGEYHREIPFLFEFATDFVQGGSSLADKSMR